MGGAPMADFEDLVAIARGDLRVMLPEHMPLPHAVYALYPHGRFLPPRVRGFIDYLLEVFASPPYWERELA